MTSNIIHPHALSKPCVKLDTILLGALIYILIKQIGGECNIILHVRNAWLNQSSLLIWFKYFLVLFRSKNIPGHSLWFVWEWVDTAGWNPRQLHHHDSGEGSWFQIHHRSYCWFFLKQIINLAKQSMSFMDKLYSNSFNNKMNMTKQLL